MENKPLKSGLILEPVVETDWLLGSSELGEVLIESGNWTDYLPTFEKQRQGFESMCCTNFSSTTVIEIIFNFLIKNNRLVVEDLEWLKVNKYLDETGHVNFSDRFDAIGSGTSPDNGNSLKNPADFKRKYGLIPESLLPWTDDRTAYFKKSSITPEMYALGAEFLKRFPINYEFAYENQIKEAFKKAPLAGACYAWPDPVNGIYPRVMNGINHAIARIKPITDQKIADSYDPYLKTLVDDYLFMNYSILYIISYKKKVTEDDPVVPANIMNQTFKFDSMPKIFIQSNTHKNKGIWIYDPSDKSAYEDYKLFIEEGLITPQPKVLSDALYASYDIVPWGINADYYIEGFWTKLLKFLGLKK